MAALGLDGQGEQGRQDNQSSLQQKTLRSWSEKTGVVGPQLTCEVRCLGHPGQGVGLPSLISKHLEVLIMLLSRMQWSSRR